VASSGGSPSRPCSCHHCAIIVTIAWIACCSSSLLIGTTSGGETRIFTTARRRVTTADLPTVTTPVLARCLITAAADNPTIEGFLAWIRRRGDVIALCAATRRGSRPVDPVTVEGRKDVLGLWAGVGGEGAKFWMSVLVDMKNRGVRDVFFVVCDGLKGLPDVVEAVWPQAIVQTCIIHLIRNTFRLTSRADSDAIKRDLKPIYTAVNLDDSPVAAAGLARPLGLIDVGRFRGLGMVVGRLSRRWASSPGVSPVVGSG
jgi:Transposase, Mutator family